MKTHWAYRRSAVVLMAAGLALLTACQQRRKGAASMIEMSDSTTAGQLTSGFYGLEDKRWRWTAGEFSVALQPPPGADDKGGYLLLQFFVPDGQIQRIGPMKLTADVGGQVLPAETVSKGGSVSYSREVPAAALRSNLVEVTFHFDKAVPPGNGDARELGAVVTRVGLVSK